MREAEGRTRQVVSCGRVVAGETVRIVDAATQQPVAAGEEGEIWVKGAHVVEGYWNKPAETAASFGAVIDGAGPFLRTGDLGFLSADELYVTGRLKDLIVYQGVNIEPSDLEATVASAHPALGEIGAAFAVERDDRDEVVVVQELSRPGLHEADFVAVTRAVLTAVAQAYGLRLHDLALVRPGTVPRTTSGKVRRRACREMYESSHFDSVRAYRRRPGDPPTA
jgi:acyl-CoA synthetase (AMP-forming)/AMP-acid ligase II